MGIQLLCPLYSFWLFQMTYDEMDELQNYYATKLPRFFTQGNGDQNFKFLYNKFPEFKRQVDLFIQEHQND